MTKTHYDVAIIGSGAGGGTLAYALADWGKKILLLEQGPYLPKSTDNWSPEAVFHHSRYKTKEKWFDIQGNPFSPGMNYYLGGNTKVYGAVLTRLRKRDFQNIQHLGGLSPKWPISYEDLEPYYSKAEKIYNVHGLQNEDPTDPRGTEFPLPPINHEPYIDELSESFKKMGLNPYHLPLGVNLNEQNPRAGKCVRCKTCDGFPCLLDAKSDAAVNAVEPALKKGNVTLIRNAKVLRLNTSSSGREISSIEAEIDGEKQSFKSNIVVVSCGAAKSAELLLRSGTDLHPEGLGNSSGQVGRNYMAHNNAFLMAVKPGKPNTAVFQKTMGINDFYFNDKSGKYPLGNIQLVGKLQKGMLTAEKPWVPSPILGCLADHSVDWWIMTEDLPHPDNRVTLTSGGDLKLSLKQTNTKAHKALIQTFSRIMRDIGYPLILSRILGIETCSHQVGTLKFGHDPKKSVLNEFCHSHDIHNLFVVDGSFFPSSSAMNPALTIMAQALRTGDWIRNNYEQL
ncbi:MAG: GMC family oxidoreductase [Deltaproteobacteria bacterium]|jgi:choline dehydrogenase-like flavoprotein|nr:GMC family oxidoreductase [Deltaproteobacteria bacterium]MBT4526665.1 GMC family oxidoreductase [Deltaproteobacteria bacterium]